MKPITVTHRNVKILIYPWRDSHRFAAYGPDGKRRYVTRRNLDDAKTAALEHAKAVAGRAIALDQLDPTRKRILTDLLEADPTLQRVRQFLDARPALAATVAQAAAECVAAKQAANPKSRYNVATIARVAAKLPQNLPVAHITPAHITACMDGAPRTRLNQHRALRTFLRWCQRSGYLPDGPTAADRVETPHAPLGTPATLTPDELHAVLAAAPAACLPWIVFGAWAGVRTDELYRAHHPLDWRDIDLDALVITIRPETSKVSRRRIIPILPPLAAAIKSLGPSDRGRIAPDDREPTKAQIRATGEPIGGWRRNALRHSFLTYRSAVVGTGQAALEAGNSEAITRRNYLDATTAQVAAKWFDVPQMFRTSVITQSDAT